jgi:hypothetical protein
MLYIQYKFHIKYFLLMKIIMENLSVYFFNMKHHVYLFTNFELKFNSYTNKQKREIIYNYTGATH